MTPAQLTKDQLESFDRDGFLILDLFSEDEIHHFKEALRRLIRSNIQRASENNSAILNAVPEGEEFDTGLFELGKIDHMFQSDIYDCMPQIPQFMQIATKPDKCAYVNQLLKKDSYSPLYCSIMRCRINEPSDDRFLYEWHQETFHTIPESRYIQTWAPLVWDATPEIGAIEVRVGSHKEGIFKQGYFHTTDDPNIIPILTIREEDLEKYPVKSVNIKLGQCLLFDGKLVHRSGQNKTSHVRYTLVGTYHDIETPQFRPMKNPYHFKGKTPQQYFEETFPNMEEEVATGWNMRADRRGTPAPTKSK